MPNKTLHERVDSDSFSEPRIVIQEIALSSDNTKSNREIIVRAVNELNEAVLDVLSDFNDFV